MNHGWEKKRLGDVCTFIGGGTPSKSKAEFYTGTIPWATVRDMSEYKLSETELKITQEAVDNSATTILPKGMIVISTHVGLGKICEIMQDTAINQDLKGVSFLSNSIDKYYFTYWYRSVSNYIIANGRGATVKGVTLDFMYNLNIPVPRLQEQKQIALELDKINELIEVKRSQLADLDLLAQSLFYEMFGDTVTNQMDWPIVLLEECVSQDCSISYGIVQPGEDYDNGIPVVRPIDFIENRFVSVNNLKRINPEISDSYKRTLLNGDEILICVRGTTGLVRLADKSLSGCNVTRGIVPLSFPQTISKTYIFEYLKQERSQEFIQHYTRGTTLKQINLSDLRKLPILIPPILLQNEFAAKLEMIEDQKKLIESSIADLQTLLASRMDYWFND